MLPRAANPISGAIAICASKSSRSSGLPARRWRWQRTVPQEALRRREPSRLAFAQNALFHDVDDAVGAIGELGDPEQRVKVAKPALAFLDVGLDHIADGAMAAVPLVTLGKLGIDEIHRLQPPDLAFQRRIELAGKRPVPGHEPCLE